jgi:hypothetical protein
MGAALAITFGSGGDSGSGASGGVVVLLILALLLAVPAVLGIALRIRDARRGERDPQDEPKLAKPPASSFLSGSWGRDSGIRGESSRSDWVLVGALAVAVLIYYIATRL